MVIDASCTNSRKLDGVVLPTNQQAPCPLELRKEPFDEPAALIPAQVAPVLGCECAGGPVWRDQVDAVLLERVIEPVAVVGALADEMVRVGLLAGAVEPELAQRDLMMIRGVCTARERQALAIHHRQELDAFTLAGRADPFATALGRGNGRIHATLAFNDGSLGAQGSGEVHANLWQPLAFAPRLKTGTALAVRFYRHGSGLRSKTFSHDGTESLGVTTIGQLAAVTLLGFARRVRESQERA